jgi:hypothetical protein
MGEARKLLRIYLNDHLAGSNTGVSLARRIVRENAGNDYARAMEPVARQIEEDQDELRGIMSAAGVRQRRVRQALARVAERLGRAKPNGSLVGYSPLSRVLELEGLTMGVTGKLELWRSLRAVSNGEQGLPAQERLETLIVRAESQRRTLEELHGRAAREALA